MQLFDVNEAKRQLQNSKIDDPTSGSAGWRLAHDVILNILNNLPPVEAVVLPCKPGTTVYEVSNNTDACYDCRYYGGGFGASYCEKPGCNYISYPTVQDAPVCEKHFFEVISYPATEQQLFNDRAKFGKTVFLSKEEAEAAFAKMG